MICTENCKVLDVSKTPYSLCGLQKAWTLNPVAEILRGNGEISLHFVAPDLQHLRLNLQGHRNTGLEIQYSISRQTVNRFIILR